MYISDILDKERIKLLKNFQKKYNLKFGNIGLLNQAFCHTSYTSENNLSENLSYERLEFFGDAVLKLATSEILYFKYPEYDEGKLTKLRSEIVSDRNISRYAKKLGFEDIIILGNNEKRLGGAKKESILACAFEALLGAIFIEYKSKGYKKALEFINDFFLDDILSIEKNSTLINPKAILQEYTQAKNHTLPKYNLIKEEGAQHNKTFFVNVEFNNKIIGQGSAKTIKNAQQIAAMNAIENLNISLED